MAIWAVAPIESRPQVTLSEWAVFDVPPARLGLPWTRHLAGWAREDCQGQVSSAVQSFDPLTGKCVTSRGRVYRLVGVPGLCSDGAYVWQVWMQREPVTEVRDVTAEVFAAIQDAQDAAQTRH